MRFLRLTLAPELVPIDESVNRIELVNTQYFTDGTVNELIRIEGDYGDVEKLLDENSATIDYEVLTNADDSQYVYRRLQPDGITHQLISLLDAHRLMIVYPMQFDRETGTSVTIMGKADMIQEAYGRFPAEIERYITIERVSESMPALDDLRTILTDRQLEVLDAAIELGYYSIPRQVTSSEVGAAVECAPSTASEHLRKIEAVVLSSLRA